MLGKIIPVPYSTEAADAADRLRLLKDDIHLVELAIESCGIKLAEDRDAIVMTLRRTQGEIDALKEDILFVDKARRQGVQL